MKDKRLVIKLKNNTAGALDSVIRKYSAYIYTVVYNVLSGKMTEEDIEETVSDAFIKLWQNSGNLREDKPCLLYTSRAYFQRLYKREFGVSVMKDVITARIALARRLLVTDRSSVAEIAVMCGYESEIYFMQQFKKETGMTPTQYRKGEL